MLFPDYKMDHRRKTNITKFKYTSFTYLSFPFYSPHGNVSTTLGNSKFLYSCLPVLSFFLILIEVSNVNIPYAPFPPVTDV